MPRKSKRITQLKEVPFDSSSAIHLKIEVNGEHSKGLLQNYVNSLSTSLVTFITGVIVSWIFYNVRQKVQLDLVGGSNEKLVENSSPCTLYVARSTIKNAGLGIFTTVDIMKGENIGPADIIIQVPDQNQLFFNSTIVLNFGYAWDGQDTGGQYEGKQVNSIVPGIGMLANGHETKYNAIQSMDVSIDSAGLFRNKHPGAGATSHYWNFSFHASRDIPKGSEIFVDYGENWFKERRSKKFVNEEENVHTDFEQNSTPSIQWLESHGSCVDNLKVGPSTNLSAGRGAFSKRSIAQGEIVSPVPVVQILDRRALDLFKVKTSGINDNHEIPDSIERSSQLLLNYCFGHRNSSILLLPMAPLVNFINHDSKNANVELRWSKSTQHDIQNPHNLSIQELVALKQAGLMLEYVATKDIQEGEEIFLNYGRQWEQAWATHVLNWKPDHSSWYKYAKKFNDDTDVIRTQEEQNVSPYPQNLFTSCYFDYIKTKHKHSARWKMSNTTLSTRNLRPCMVLDRHEDPKNNTNLHYTVAILNRYGLHEKNRIPTGSKFIVTHVPRFGIKFTGKLYTSDQHAVNAFRHEIELTDDVFPVKWMNL